MNMDLQHWSSIARLLAWSRGRASKLEIGQRVVSSSGWLELTDMLGQLLAALGSIRNTVQVYLVAV